VGELQIALRQMTHGHTIIENRSYTGLTLRQHPTAVSLREIENLIFCPGGQRHCL